MADEVLSRWFVTSFTLRGCLCFKVYSSDSNANIEPPYFEFGEMTSLTLTGLIFFASLDAFLAVYELA